MSERPSDGRRSASTGRRRRSPGPRRAALEQRRKRRRRRGALGGVGLAALGALVAVVAGYFVSREVGDSADEPAPAATTAEPDSVTTTLVVGTLERSKGEPQVARWLTLLSLDERSGEGAVVYVPAHTAFEIPGRGLQALADVFPSGGIPLVVVTMESQLGVEVDRYLELSQSDARVLFDATGPLSVDVPTEVRVSAGKKRTRLVFTEGPQRLSAPFLVTLLYTIGVQEDDAELGNRHVAFWDALFETFAPDPTTLSDAITTAGAALAESDSDPSEHARFFESLAALAEEDRIVTTLPVRQVSVGGDELYEADAEEIGRFVSETFGPAPVAQQEVDVQILNGNGVPGIGQKVAQRLAGHGFRVILSGNARRLNYRNTLIITYDSSPEGQADAERAKELLDVGRVQVSAQDQGIVDLTIVVGKDFLRTR